VDAIEHWMIYKEHPSVGAIVHIHAWWSDPIPSTQVNYPCGTYEIAAEVAELVRRAPDPSRAVIGLKNHGLTITGHSIDEIFKRIEGKLVPQVPMNSRITACNGGGDRICHPRRLFFRLR
jgi:ribulose-5-phosphate 4-epimerase/fuculose-1-phosphate aldolase